MDSNVTAYGVDHFQDRGCDFNKKRALSTGDHIPRRSHTCAQRDCTH